MGSSQNYNIGTGETRGAISFQFEKFEGMEISITSDDWKHNLVKIRV